MYARMHLIELWVGIAGAMLAPVIGVTTAYVAVQQYRIKKTEVRIELYHERKKIFDTFKDFLVESLNSDKWDDEKNRRFMQSVSEVPFLFGSDIEELRQEIYKDACRLSFLEKKLNNEPHGPGKRNHLLDEYDELAGKMHKRLSSLGTRFRTYLRMS
ncbi:MAG: hypothetical protein KDD60_07425 [Bdellovibrionales bacterium]|nr:hypothetical protein [Bdellovibrionales bacterium]